MENKDFNFRETLTQFKFLEKDVTKAKSFVFLLRRYKRFIEILQNEPIYLELFPIKFNFISLMKEIKVYLHKNEQICKLLNCY